MYFDYIGHWGKSKLLNSPEEAASYFIGLGKA
jgi:hypothetical protein